MTLKPIFPLIAATFLVPALAPTSALANVTFDCGQSGGTFYEVRLIEASNAVEVSISNAATNYADRFYLAPSGGTLYHNPNTGFTFDDQNGVGVLSSTTGLRFNCVVSDITGAPETTAPAGNFPGRSFGGNLRAGPGTSFADVGSTFNGQTLTLVSDSGVPFNGFNWWLVQLQNGQQAYQWGGLLCAPGYNLGGIFNQGC